MKRNQEYIEKSLKSARTFLSRWNGSNVVLWELTSSHKTLRMLVSLSEDPKNLLISCIDPKKINGPVQWQHCQLEVKIKEESQENELEIVVYDSTIGFEVICGKIEVKENVKLW